MRVRSSILFAGCVVFSFFGCSYHVPVFASSITAEALLNAEEDALESSIKNFLGDRRRVKGLHGRKHLTEYYQERDFKAVWVRDLGVRSDGRDLLDLLRESWMHGLNPERYHVSRLETLIDTDLTPDTLAEIEILMSDAYIRYGQALTGIRVDPRPLDTHRRFWRKSLDVEALFAHLESAGSVEDAVETIAPKSRTYKRLQEELEYLLTGDAPSYEAVLPITMKKRFLNPYERDKAVPDIRLRLGVDAPEDDIDPYMYDDALSAAVLGFQRAHNVKADGIIGAQTLGLMNISRQDKINQVVANMERLRWVAEEKPDKYVIVNIPSATLWAVENGAVAFEMPVIVGRKKRPTNMFITEIHGVRFNPTWTVPPTIKRDDILPKLVEDPMYLASKGMDLIAVHEGERMSIDPETIDWASLTESDLSALQMVQIPGAHNPLGRVRVLMPNRYNIYLHDTNERHYFSRASRALSSGCVRLKEPEKMADFIMQKRPGWEGKMETFFADEKMRDLYVRDTIPVYLLYYTVWLNEQGDVIYGNDLYDYDKKLIKILRNLDEIFISVDNT